MTKPVATGNWDHPVRDCSLSTKISGRLDSPPALGTRHLQDAPGMEIEAYASANTSSTFLQHDRGARGSSGAASVDR